MKCIDFTFPTPEENLACDEALLEGCEAGQFDELLRFWQPQLPFVVLGISGISKQEVHLERCRKLKIPVLRRISGGGTVLQGPGCLNFSLLLKMKSGTALTQISETTRFVLKRQIQALQPHLKVPIQQQGLSDLTLKDLKFSGNAQRRKRSYLLFHGTVLLEWNPELMEEILPSPDRQPAYRKNRKHGEFLTKLPLTPEQVKSAFKAVWNSTEIEPNLPVAEIDRLVKERYTRDAWNRKF